MSLVCYLFFAKHIEIFPTVNSRYSEISQRKKFINLGNCFTFIRKLRHLFAVLSKANKMFILQGEQPHCGFPEKNFSANVEKLARKVCTWVDFVQMSCY